ncbi:chaplin [Streptomyces sp. NPDC021749]|uniref:chaplin n=1 Tax=Streptomyces sp. NPDC021749 TaxID=3154905 RepID=UPI0033C24A8F
MKYAKAASITAGTLMVMGSAAPAFANAGAAGVAKNSPGVISGNNIQVPISIPINLCGNTVNIVALLNPAFGNNCLNR